MSFVLKGHVSATGNTTGAGPTSAIASTARSSALAASGWKISANICSISMSSMNFS